MLTQTSFPKSGYHTSRGLVFFPRMLDKIRLHAAGVLPDDYKRGTGLDARMCAFLKIEHAVVAAKAREEADDEVVLEWCFVNGRRPTDEEIAYFNAFMTKRGWRDDASAKLAESKAKRSIAGRDDIQTTFDLQDFEEGRK